MGLRVVLASMASGIGFGWDCAAAAGQIIQASYSIGV